MVCVWFIYRKMEPRFWLVHGNVENNRINELNGKTRLSCNTPHRLAPQFLYKLTPCIPNMTVAFCPVSEILNPHGIFCTV